MKIIDLIKDDDVRQLARKSDILAGREIWKTGHTGLGTVRPGEYIEAIVQAPNTQTRHTRFELKSGKLAWHCTCTSDPKLFCKHLVAAALQVQKEGRGDIYKAAGIILQDRKMLVERSVGKPAFIAPGGRIEPGETAPQSLVRELQEEFNIVVSEADLEPFGSFTAVAANHPGQQVHMEVFIVKRWRGEIRPSNEVEEILWLGAELPEDVEIGSIFGHEVLPMLQQQGLVD